MDSKKEKKSEYDRQYRLINSEKIRNYNKTEKRKRMQSGYIKKSHKNPDIKAKREAYYKKWRNSPNGKIYQKTSDLMKLHGITYDKYLEMVEKQDGRCAICHTHKDNLTKALCVDHSHKTEKIRGLLCDKCNKGIGLLNEDILILEEAINYLKTPKV